MNRKIGLMITILMSLILTACAGKKEGPVVPDDTSVVTDGNTGSSYPYPYSDLTASELEALGIYGDPLNEKVVYFEYNSTAIDRRSQVILAAHSRFLGERAGAGVALEGHADERGTRDYNLALGERRAKVVADFLAANGSQSSNQTISYGEERPVDTSHTESAWQKNRRVEIKY